MSPIITRNRAAVCLSLFFCTVHSIRSADTIRKSIHYRRRLTKTAFQPLKCISTFMELHGGPVFLYSDRIYAQCAAAGCQTPGRETQDKSGQATFIDSDVSVLPSAL